MSNRDNVTRLDSSSSYAVVVVRTNERPWRRRPVMASCAAVPTVDIRKNRIKAHFFGMEIRTRTELLLLLLVAATGLCWLCWLLLLAAAVAAWRLVSMPQPASSDLMSGIQSIPPQRRPIETHISLVCIARLLCCCITHDPPSSVLVAFTVRQ